MSKFQLLSGAVVVAITFAQLVEHGRNNGANIVNGMPWSFSYGGAAISHENDQCYVVTTATGQKLMTPLDLLVTHASGELEIVNEQAFLTMAQRLDPPQVDPIEAEIQSKGLTAPRITLDDINAAIASEHCFTAREGVLGAIAADGVQATAYEQANAAPSELGLLTFCVLIMRNGFTVVGKSAVASPENFDADLGKKIAREDAIKQCWPLMGFELRSRLAGAPEVAAAVAVLEISAKTCETNAAIHATEGNAAQAALSIENARSYRAAMKLLAG